MVGLHGDELRAQLHSRNEFMELQTFAFLSRVNQIAVETRSIVLWEKTKTAPLGGSSALTISENPREADACLRCKINQLHPGVQEDDHPSTRDA